MGVQGTGDIFGGTNQSVGGGIYSRRGVNILHGLVVVGLLDCKTGKPLASTGLTRVLSNGKMAFPTKALPEELARTKVAGWTPEVEQQLKQMVVTLPGQAWVDTLRKMAPPAK